MYIDSSVPVQDYRPRYPFQTGLKWVPGAFQLVSSEQAKLIKYDRKTNVVAQDN